MTELTPAAMRAARALLKWTMRDLERESGVALATINAIENSKRPRPPQAATATKIAQAFADHGVELLGDGKPGARLGQCPP
ncbi:helix-turn-helix domain-containing protein [Brevundimonas goettingensis]|uniref:Helix-turn-helix transcriptional regulator n=1 Tax=Brevundimonas goettingensis TaxID=2774190 RepID=A0A975C338_9CAUL|nr:helix-turn-helix transcriptional regulator [Brevundimonas goettingensis]QTC90441.1 helix-turn-helix transcriptional regulator [Brevundimonas goettingensis]